MRAPHSISARPVSNPDTTLLVSLLIGAIVIGSLYFAREILIPLALAVLISFVLAPLAVWLRRMGLPRVPSVLVVVLMSFGIILGIGALGAAQISQLAEKLPEYQSNIRTKIRALKGSATNNGAVTRATSVLEDIGREIAGEGPPQAIGNRAPGAEAPPVPVEIRKNSSNPFEIVSGFLNPILSPLASTAIVLLFVMFFLLQREDLRDRVIRVLGTNELYRTTEAMDEAATRLSRYFLLQTILNTCFGCFVGIGLWLIGVPSPLLWGIFTMLMRFVPYVGSVLAAILPIALAAAVDPGWTMIIWTIALFALGEPIMGHVIEPFVFGHHTGLSPVAIVVAATFWTWLWGPIGLLVSTPLTLCLVILGQYTRRLEFLHILLGDEPALTPAQTFYQRLIAGDPAEALDQAEEQLEDMSLLDYYDDVALEALELAQRDVHAGGLSAERQTLLAEGVFDLVEELADHKDTLPDGTQAERELSPGHEPAGLQVLKREWQIEKPVLCLSGSGPIDHAAGALLVHIVERSGIGAELGGPSGVAKPADFAGPRRNVPMICFSYVGFAKPAQVRLVVRRARRLFPKAKILIGLWRMSKSDPALAQIMKLSGADFFATSFKDALALFLHEGGLARDEDLHIDGETGNVQQVTAKARLMDREAISR